MPEEEATQAPETTQDTPAQEQAAPDEDTPQEEQVNYEQRYNDLRPEFDRATQEREEARQEALAWQILANPDDHDDDQVRLAAEIVDVELDPDDENEEEFEDPNDQRLSKIEQALATQQAAEGQKAFNSDLDRLAEGASVELTKRDRRAIQIAAEENKQHGFSPEATEESFKEFLEERRAYDKAVIDGYVNGKKNAPARPPGGSNANEQPDLDDRQARQAWMTERYQVGRQ